MAWRILIGLVAALSLHAATIIGTVADPEGKPIPRVTIRLLDEARKLGVQIVSGPDGKFKLGGIAPGSYLLTAHMYPFLQRAVAAKASEPDGTVDLGTIRLAISDCMLSSIGCETFEPSFIGGTERQMPRTRSFVVAAGCVVDAENLTVLACRSPKPEYGGDFMIRSDSSGTWIEAWKSSRIAEFVEASQDCGAPLRTLRIDGLGHTYPFCVITAQGRTSRVYLPEEVQPGADPIRLQIVTRP